MSNVLSVGTCRQAAGGSEGDMYDFKGKGTMDNQYVSALNINAALYRSMLASFVILLINFLHLVSILIQSLLNNLFASIFIEWVKKFYAEEKDSGQS